jgi:hypothetical protein
MSTIEFPRGKSEEVSDLETRKADIKKLVEEKGTSMWFSGTGSRNRADIFVPLEGSWLRPTPSADKQRIIGHDGWPDGPLVFPDMEWAVRMSSGRTVFQDSGSGEVGVRYTEMRRFEDGSVYDYDTFDYENGEEDTIAELERYLEEVFAGEPVRSELANGTAFEMIPNPAAAARLDASEADVYITF